MSDGMSDSWTAMHNDKTMSTEWKVEQWEGEDYIITGFGLQHPSTFRKSEAERICAILKLATPLIIDAIAKHVEQRPIPPSKFSSWETKSPPETGAVDVKKLAEAIMRYDPLFLENVIEVLEPLTQRISELEASQQSMPEMVAGTVDAGEIAKHICNSFRKWELSGAGSHVHVYEALKPFTQRILELECECKAWEESTRGTHNLMADKARLQRAFDAVNDMGIHPASLVGKYEKRSERMEGWNDAVMEMVKRQALAEPDLETSYDRLADYVDKAFSHLAQDAHGVYEVVDAAKAELERLKEGNPDDCMKVLISDERHEELLASEARSKELRGTLQTATEGSFGSTQAIAAVNAELRARANELEAQLESAEYMGNLLAIIHCDGGHYRAEHGDKKATDDAIEIVSGLKLENERLKAEFEQVAFSLEMHWKGAGAKLESGWMIKEIVHLGQLYEDAADRVEALQSEYDEFKRAALTLTSMASIENVMKP